jgi:pyruvate,orthophosphate dikinase
MPDIYQQLLHAETTLENHFKDMQDMEFTIQEGKLWMLQTRNGKRTGAAMVRIAMEMLQAGHDRRENRTAARQPGSPQ